MNGIIKANICFGLLVQDVCIKSILIKRSEIMESVTKAITFKLLPITNSKMDRLLSMAKNFKEIYDYAAMMIPSFQDTTQTKARPALEAIRKDLQFKTKLHSQITQEAIDYARSNYLTILSQSESVNPVLKEMIIRFHNQVWGFKKHNERTYISIPCEKIGSRYKYLWLPVKINEYHNNLINNNQKWGAGQINVNKQTFTSSITVKIDRIEYIPETFIGVDLGLNNLATIAVINKNKKILKTKFWNGKETRHIRNRFDKYRCSVAKIGRVDLQIKTKGYESNWMKNVNHNISREIIELAKLYPNPIIMLEELHRFTKIKWNFYQLRQMIKYKAEHDCILTHTINPQYTSQTCHKCGHIDKENRHGFEFKCMMCGYSLHADLNAAVNIASNTKEQIQRY